jgi:hypothetical protein
MTTIPGFTAQATLSRNASRRRIHSLRSRGEKCHAVLPQMQAVSLMTPDDLAWFLYGSGSLGWTGSSSSGAGSATSVYGPTFDDCVAECETKRGAAVIGCGAEAGSLKAMRECIRRQNNKYVDCWRACRDRGRPEW